MANRRQRCRQKRPDSAEPLHHQGSDQVLLPAAGVAGGELIAYLERGAHSLLVARQPGDPALSEAFAQLADTIDAGRVDEITIERINGDPALEARRYRDDLVQAGFAMVPQGFRKRRRA